MYASVTIIVHVYSVVQKWHPFYYCNNFCFLS